MSTRQKGVASRRAVRRPSKYSGWAAPPAAPSCHSSRDAAAHQSWSGRCVARRRERREKTRSKRCDSSSILTGRETRRLQARRQQMYNQPRRHIRKPADDENRSIVASVRLKHTAGNPLEENATHRATERADAHHGSDREFREHITGKRIDVGRPRLMRG